MVKKVVVHSLPHLCLFALKDITFGTELRYDYGVKDLPWRMKLPKVSQDIENIYQESPSSTVLPYAVKVTKSVNKKGCKQKVEDMERVNDSEPEEYENELLPYSIKESSFKVLERKSNDFWPEKVSYVESNHVIPPFSAEVELSSLSDQSEEDILNDSGINGDFPQVVDTDNEEPSMISVAQDGCSDSNDSGSD